MSYLWRDFARNVSTARPGLPAHLFLERPMARRNILRGVAFVGTLALSGLQMHEVRADAPAPGSDGARQFINELANKAIAVMAEKSESDADRSQMFQALFVSSFDLPAIGQRVLGRYWRTASPEQRDKFLKLFQQQEVLTWASRFKSYNGQRLVVESADPGQNGGWDVRSHIEQPSGGSPIPLTWTVNQVDGGWRVTDIVVSGASMSLTLRQDFGSVLDANGGKVDGLLAAMQKKIDQLRST
jgi:phospholipid transport system substrate-binding protein